MWVIHILTKAVMLKVFTQNSIQKIKLICIILTFYLTIIPQARMGYESIAHEAEGQMGC